MDEDLFDETTTIQADFDNKQRNIFWEPLRAASFVFLGPVCQKVFFFQRVRFVRKNDKVSKRLA